MGGACLFDGIRRTADGKKKNELPALSVSDSVSVSKNDQHLIRNLKHPSKFAFVTSKPTRGRAPTGTPPLTGPAASNVARRTSKQY